MKFERYVFGVALFDWSVAKYTDGERVKLMAEHTDGRIAEDISFESQGEFEKWVDSVVDYNTQIEDQFESLRLILAEMEK